MDDEYRNLSGEMSYSNNEIDFRLLVDNAYNVILILDRNHTIKYINQTFPPNSREDVIGRPIYDFIHSDFTDIVKKKLDYVFQTGNKATYETKIVESENKISWYKTNISPIKDDNEILFVCLIANDITEKK